MASVRERILAEIEARINADAPGRPDGLEVHRHVERAVQLDAESGQLAEICIYPAPDTPDVPTHDFDLIERSFTVRCEMTALAMDGQPPSAAVDPLYVWAVRRLLADPTLGGLAVMLLEGQTQFAELERGAAYGRAFTDFEITYHTTQDPEAQP